MKKYLLSIIVYLTLFATSTWASRATISPALTNEMEVCSQENISIELSGNRLRVRNASGEQLEIYSVTGKKVASYRVECSDQTFQLDLGKGCYIVKVQNVARKISISK